MSKKKKKKPKGKQRSISEVRTPSDANTSPEDTSREYDAASKIGLLSFGIVAATSLTAFVLYSTVRSAALPWFFANYNRSGMSGTTPSIVLIVISLGVVSFSMMANRKMAIWSLLLLGLTLLSAAWIGYDSGVKVDNSGVAVCCVLVVYSVIQFGMVRAVHNVVATRERLAARKLDENRKHVDVGKEDEAHDRQPRSAKEKDEILDYLDKFKSW